MKRYEVQYYANGFWKTHKLALTQQEAERIIERSQSIATSLQFRIIKAKVIK